MSKRLLPVASLAAVALALGFSACGGSSTTAAVVARVGDVPITQAAVNQWMNTLIGGDYYELSEQHTVPPELVSDPPNYPRCVEHLQTAATKSPETIVRLTSLQMLKKCTQLNEALKEQATSYLINAQWLIGFDRELGVTATQPEVESLYRKLKATKFPSAAVEHQYFQSQHLTAAQELFIVKLDVLRNEDEKRVEAGGQRAFAVIQAAEKRWNEKITCRPGYVVAHCREYTGGEEQSYVTTPSPAILMEEVAAIATGRCTAKAACISE